MVPPLTLLDLVNFGMALIIWMVQLIIYPGFAHYPADRLVGWHGRYTSLIAVFVVPLMVGQLFLLARAAYLGGGPTANGMLVMTLLAWGVTFKYSVSLHRKITDNQDVAGSVALLIKTNWPRTVLWSGVFLVGLFSA